MLRRLLLLLVVALFSSGCVVGVYQPCVKRSRSALIDSLQTHYCSQGEWPESFDEPTVSPNCSQEQRRALGSAGRVQIFQAGLDGMVLMQEGVQPDRHVVTLLSRPVCDDPQEHAEGGKRVTWVSFAIPSGFTRITPGEPNDSEKANASSRKDKLFELPGKHTVVFANLRDEEFSVSQLEQLKLSYETNFPRVFKNVAWVRRELELNKDRPRTVFVFTADRLETNTNTGEDRWVFVALAMLAGQQLFAVEAAAPLSQQKTLEKLVQLVTDTVEFESRER